MVIFALFVLVPAIVELNGDSELCLGNVYGRVRQMLGAVVCVTMRFYL